MRKKVGKGTLNIACPSHPVSLPRLTDHPSCGRVTKTQQKKLLVGAWNVRTLLDRDNTARPERRTALIAKELTRYRIDIAALSETRLADEGTMKDDGGGYTFVWHGKPETEDRIHGSRFHNKNQSDEIDPQSSCRDQQAVDETSPPIPPFNYH